MRERPAEIFATSSDCLPHLPLTACFEPSYCAINGCGELSGAIFRIPACIVLTLLIDRNQCSSDPEGISIGRSKATNTQQDDCAGNKPQEVCMYCERCSHRSQAFSVLHLVHAERTHQFHRETTSDPLRGTKVCGPLFDRVPCCMGRGPSMPRYGFPAPSSPFGVRSP